MKRGESLRKKLYPRNAFKTMFVSQFDVIPGLDLPDGGG
jgi:hypothetical protein